MVRTIPRWARPLIILLPLAIAQFVPHLKPLIVLALLVATFVAFLIVRRRYRWRLKRQCEVDVLTGDIFKDLASGENSQYILFLRPFSADPVVAHKLIKPFWRIGSIFEVFDDADLSVNEVIHDAVRNTKSNLPLITLRGRRPSGIGENQDSIEDWQLFVSSASEKATLILVLLGATDGLILELEQLARSGLSRKTVFVMPPITRRPVARLVRNRGIMEEESHELYKMLCEFGLDPPLPTTNGQVFFFGDNKNPVCVDWTWNGRALGKIVEVALQQLYGTQRPGLAHH